MVKAAQTDIRKKATELLDRFLYDSDCRKDYPNNFRPLALVAFQKGLENLAQGKGSMPEGTLPALDRYLSEQYARVQRYATDERDADLFEEAVHEVRELSNVAAEAIKAGFFDQPSQVRFR